MLCCLAVPAIILTLLIMSPLCAALLPILALPTVWLMWQWHASDRDKAGDLETMIWIYVISGTAGTLVVLLMQAIFSYLFAILLFQSQLPMYLKEWEEQQNTHLDNLQFNDASNERLGENLSYQWQYFLFLALTCYVTVAMTEEGLKYYSLVYVRRYHAAVHERAYIAYAIVSALGFSTFENIGFTYQACRVESASRLAITVCERVAIGAPLHLGSGILLAVNVIRRDLRHEPLDLWQVMQVPILLHGTFDFGLLALSAANGNVGWVHPTSGISVVLGYTFTIAMLVTVYLLVRDQLRKHHVPFGVSW